ncbi:serine hydrolase [Deinococcus yavapaiensis]|uniref:Beta-lactamase class A n=1 Tax=Deinococcus yavapaiensis KR-236 TaxID=694435 RepID=A0A318S7N1_9DEIO|nr:serine hydrolase [Deinococcus yavapaiensis]PYE54452.1 beta-lactamase class A [Deinococcus yavapaiensis KR-236]
MTQIAESLLARHPGAVSIIVRDAETGDLLFERSPDRPFHAASTIKVPLLVRALQRVDEESLSLDERREMRSKDQVGGAGVLHELGPGLALTLRDLLTLMIIVSDNTATNIVIDLLGIDDVNAFLRAQGFTVTDLVGKLQLPSERHNERQRRGERNRANARELCELLYRLTRGTLLSPASTALALDILRRQQLKDIIGRRAPRDADGELRFEIASKSGELRGVHHDVGVVRTKRPLVIAVLSDGGEDPREHPENREVVLLAEVVSVLMERFGDITPGSPSLDSIR